MKDKKKVEKENVPHLTTEELKLISQVLYNSRWTGREWQQTIVPLINKLGKMIDQERKSKLKITDQ